MKKILDFFSKLKKISTTKFLITFLFVDCIAVQFFVAYATVMSVAIAEAVGAVPTFEPLIALVGAVVAEAIGFGIYCIKSAKENSKDGIVYELAMRNKQKEEEIDAEDETSGNG